MTDFEDYIKEKKTIDLLDAGRLALYLFVIALVVFGIAFYLIWRPEFSFSVIRLLLFILLFIVGVVLHELIHGLVFALYAKKGLKSISFGVLKEYLTPYCHCNEPIKLKGYIIGALMPALLLGIVPVIISFFNGSMMLLLLGVFFISAAGGDFLIVWMLRNESKDSYVLDHPSEAGCFIYHKRQDI